MKVPKAILLLCFLAIPPFVISFLMPALSKIHLYFSVNIHLAELGIWIILLGYLVGQFIYIPLSKHYNPVISLRFGLLILLIAYVFLRVSICHHWFILFEVGEFVTGLGIASCYCCTYALLNQNYSHEHVKQLLPYAIFAYALFGSLATWISSSLSQHGDWQSNIDVIPIVTVIAFLVSWLFRSRTQLPPQASTSLKKCATNYRVLLVYGLGLGFIDYIGYGYPSSMPLLSTQVLKIHLSTYGAYTFITALIAVIPAFFLSFYSLKKLGARKAFIYSMALNVLLILVLYSLRFIPHKVVLPLFVVVGLLDISGAVSLIAAAYLASNASDNKQYAASLMGFLNIAAILAGLFIQDTLPLFSFSAFLLVSATLLSLAFIASLIESRGKHAYN
jgi:MFS family permease